MKRLAFIPLAILLFSVSCASSGDLNQMDNQIVDLHDEVAQLKRQASSKEEVEKLNQSLAKQTKTILQSNADLSVKVSELEDRLQNAQGFIEQANYRIDRLVQQISQNQRDIAALQNALRAMQPPAPADAGTPGATAGATSASTGTTPPAAATTTAASTTTAAPGSEIVVQPPAQPQQNPLDLYQGAYRDYQRGNYDFAIQGFKEFLDGSPNSDLADNAAYWIGECYYSQKKYRDAIRQFDEVINKYQQSDKVPAALLKKGLSYIELGEKAQGIVQLQYVVHEHPSSAEASLAREKLKALGIDTR